MDESAVPRRPSLKDWFIWEERELSDVVDEDAAELESGRFRWLMSTGGKLNGLGE